MNAKELMIGDWVINTEGKEQIRDVVRKISPEFLGLRYSRRYVPIECIEPIPITPELLKANGFDIEEQENAIVCSNFKQPKKPLLLHNCGTRLNFLYENILTTMMSESSDNIISRNIRYVHQLQHAFRMLQYDDLADNFKVI
jgi:hypothetical protein